MLAEVLAEAQRDPDALAALAKVAFKDLRGSLRSNLGGREGPDLSDPARLRSLLADAGKLARDRPHRRLKLCPLLTPYASPLAPA